MFYEWQDNLSVGVPSIDRQHKVLIALINELHTAIEAGEGQAIAKHVLKKLINYAKAHFIYEEGLFTGQNYEATAEHLDSHRKIEAKLADLKLRSNDPGYNLSDELMLFLKNWLTNHILKEDMGYSELLVSNNTM